jgi:putative endonuclease
MSWNVYILRCADDTLYTGICKDLRRRLEQHNQAGSTAAKYTRGRLPVQLIYSETQADRAAATIREMRIKKMSRAEKLQLAGAM